MITVDAAKLAMSLSKEIDRILTSPYPVTLQPLEDILLSDNDGSVFNSYAIANPCKLRGLVLEVIEAVEIWPQVITILKALSASSTFCRCMLQQSPEILDALLTEATSTSDARVQYSEVCMLLLAEPLPVEVPLPASAQHFFVRTVKNAIGNPTASTLWAVHSLLTGACHQLPRMLPRENWIALEEELTHIVRSTRTIQNQSISLICFGIIYALAVPNGSTLQEGIVTLHDNVQLTSDAARDFFAGGKAQRSLNLAALQVTWCCKTNIGVSHTDALKLFGIALDIFRTVDRKILEKWSKGNEGETNIRRMMSKLMEPGLDPELQLQLSALLATIAEFSKLAPQTMTKLERIVITAKSMRYKSHQVCKAMGLVFSAFAHHFSDNVVASLVQESLKAASPSTSTSSLPECSILSLELQLMATSVIQHPAPRRRVMAAFFCPTGDTQMQDFLHQEFYQPTLDHGSMCNATLLEERRSLGCVVTSLYLKTFLLCRPEEVSRSENVAISMLEKSQELAKQFYSCAQVPRRATRQKLDLNVAREHNSNPNLRVNEHWKTQLLVHAQSEANDRQDALVRLVGGICHDLEQRCHIAEEPLRQEQQKVEKLQEEVIGLTEQNKHIQGQLTERDMLLETFESEKTETENYLKAAQTNNKELLSRIDDLERNLRDSKNDAEKAIRQIKSDNESWELNLRAALASKDSAAEDMADQIKEAERNVQKLEHDLSRSRHHASELNKECQQLKDDLHVCQQKLESEKGLKGHGEEALQQAQNECHKLQIAVRDMEAKQNEMSSSYNELRAKLENDIEGLRREAEGLISTHEASVEELASKLAEQKQSHDLQLAGVVSKFEFAEKQASRLEQIIEQNDATMSELQHQIAQLEDIVGEKEKEIEEFQAMRQTLTAALDRKPPRNSVRLSKTVQSNQRSPDTRRRSTRVGTESHVTQLTQVEHFDEGDHSFESTSSKSGPTPKRARPRQVFKIPEIRQPQLGVTARKSAKIRNRRLPLRDVSSGRGNLSPLKPRRMSKGSPLKQDNWERNQTGEEDEADLEFGSEILFTSTPFPTNLPQIEDGLDGGESTTMDE